MAVNPTQEHRDGREGGKMEGCDNGRMGQWKDGRIGG